MRGETCQNSTIGEPFSIRPEDARFVKRWRISTSGEACRIVEPFSVRPEDARFVKRWRVSTSGEACRIVAFREVGARFDEWRRGVLSCRASALREAETRFFYTGA